MGVDIRPVFPQGATALSGLSDVVLGALAGGQVLTYDAASGKWKNIAPAAYVPYTGATNDVDLGTHHLATNEIRPSSGNYVFFNASHSPSVEDLGGGVGRINSPYVAASNYVCGATTLVAANFQYVAAIDQNLGVANSPTFTTLTINTPGAAEKLFLKTSGVTYASFGDLSADGGGLWRGKMGSTDEAGFGFEGWSGVVSGTPISKAPIFFKALDNTGSSVAASEPHTAFQDAGGSGLAIIYGDGTIQSNTGFVVGAAPGVTGSFIDLNGLTVTVTGGIITSIV